MAETSIRRVLIHRLGSLGDMVVALPCFHLIARRFPQAERRLLTNIPVNAKAPAAAEVLSGSGLVHGYIRYRVGTRAIGELLRVAREIRQFRPDLLVMMTDLRPWGLVQRDLLFLRMCGLQYVVGTFSEEEIARRFDAATGMWESEAHRLTRLCEELGDARVHDPASWDLRLTEAEQRAAREVLRPLEGKPLIVCGPGTKMQSKDWGKENWRELLRRLTAAYPGHALALVGAQEDAEVGEFAAEEWAGPKVNLCGRLTPRETAAVIEHARVFLGPDSGPMHLAASVGVRCVIAFSSRGQKGVWYPAGSGHEIIYHGPECAGCRLETCTEQRRKCLTSISVDEMEDAVGRVLGGVRVGTGRLIQAC